MKSRAIPEWHNLDKHVYVRAINACLTHIGFEFDAADPHFLTWLRPAFEKANLFIRLLPQRAPKGYLQFGVQLGAESIYVMDAANAVKIWECGLGMAAREDFPYREPIDVVGISLHWGRSEQAS